MLRPKKGQDKVLIFKTGLRPSRSYYSMGWPEGEVSYQPWQAVDDEDCAAARPSLIQFIFYILTKTLVLRAQRSKYLTKPSF